MSSNLNPPKRSDFTLLISEISELLQPNLDDRIRNELTPRPTAKPVDQKHAVSIRESLGAVAKNIGKARKDLNAIMAFFDTAEEYTTQQLQYYTKFKAYIKRTTSQRALRCELAPIRRLPNEIFQLIFTEVHAQSSEKEQYTPITAQVCTFWRQLAHTTAFLWTSINVNLQEEEGAMDAVDQMETRIERAKGQLVSVQLSINREPLPAMARPKNHPFTAAIRALLKYKDKIASLRIPRHDDKLSGHLARRCEKEKITFKNLRTLVLYDTYFVLNLKHKVLFQACPKLERLRISDPPDTSAIPWETLKEFKGPLRAQGLSEFLSRARNIKQAEISSLAWNTLPTIKFNNSLTALELGSLLEGCAARLASIPPPSNLRYLSIATPYQPLMNSWGPALEFLAIPLNTWSTEAKVIWPALSATPNLQGLRICITQHIPPNLFTLLPKLTHLEFRTGHNAESKESVQAILSRPLRPRSRGKRLPLRSVTFLPYSVPDRDRNARIWNRLYQDLNNVGIEVHDYRTVEDPEDYPFKTPFFVEHGWCI